MQDFLKVVKDSPFGRGDVLWVSGGSNRYLVRQWQHGPLAKWTPGMDNWMIGMSKKMEEYGFKRCFIQIVAEESHTVGAENAEAWAERLDLIRKGREDGTRPNMWSATTCITYWGYPLAIEHCGFTGLGMFHGTLDDAEGQVEMAQSTGKPFGLYGCRGRLVPGFYLWKAGAYGTFHEFCAPYWGLPNNDWDNPMGTDGGPASVMLEAPGHCTTVHSPTGRMIGSWFWEEMREGVDDDAYMHTLETMVKEAEGDERPAVRAARDAVQRTLSEIRDYIDLDVTGVSGWVHRPFPPEDFDALRWKASSAVLKLTAAQQKGEVLVATGGQGQRKLLKSVAFQAEPKVEGDTRKVTKPTALHVRPLTGKIVLDGLLKEPIWHTKPAVDGFVDWHAQVVEPRTRAWLAADGGKLYVGVKCFEPKIRTMLTTDHRIYINDCIEFFLDRDHTHSSYYHLLTSAAAQVKGKWHPSPGNLRGGPSSPATARASSCSTSRRAHASTFRSTARSTVRG